MVKENHFNEVIDLKWSKKVDEFEIGFQKLKKRLYELGIVVHIIYNLYLVITNN